MWRIWDEFLVCVRVFPKNSLLAGSYHELFLGLCVWIGVGVHLVLSVTFWLFIYVSQSASRFLPTVQLPGCVGKLFFREVTSGLLLESKMKNKYVNTWPLVLSPGRHRISMSSFVPSLDDTHTHYHLCLISENIWFPMSFVMEKYNHFVGLRLS